MAKKKSGRFKNKPTGLAAYVGRAMGKLMAKRDRLGEAAGRRRQGNRGRAEHLGPSPAGPIPPRKAATVARKPMSEATRKKMADAAKARWAAVKKAGNQRQG